jgi:conjugal transfer ATP-binding protein TraC
MDASLYSMKMMLARFFGAGDKSTAGTPSAAVMENIAPPSIERLKSYFSNHRLSELLPYEYYDENSGLFYNTDSYGFVLEVSTLVGGAPEEVANILSGLFTQMLPKNTGIQFILHGSPAVTPLLKAWANERLPDSDSFDEITGKQNRNKNIYRQMARRRFEFLKDKSRNSMFNDETFFIRDFRLYVSVVFSGKPSEAEERSAISKRKEVIGTLKSANMEAIVLNAQGLINFLDVVLNPKSEVKREPVNWGHGRLIRDQVIDGETNMLVDAEGLVINQTDVRSLSVRSYPVHWGIWLNGDFIGDMFRAALRLPGSFLLTMGVTIPDQELVQKKISAKHIRATQNSESVMARFMPHMAEQKKDYDFVVRKLNEGSSIVTAYHQLVMFNSLGEGYISEQAVKSLFRSKGWTLQLDKYMQVQGLLAALPMTLDKNLYTDIKNSGRTNTMLTHTAANMLPIVSEWKGTGTPRLMLFGRNGQIQFIDPFDNVAGNFNMAVTASSGSGKSFLVNELIMSILGSGGRMWVIDVGRSYESTAKLLGGEFIVFSEEANINVNPFTYIKDSEDVAGGFIEAAKVLKPVIAQMAKPKGGTDDYEDSVIERAIKNAWERKRNKATITDVAIWMTEQEDKRAKDMATMLTPYCIGGIYEKYFEGDCNLDFTNNFIVLELEELNSMKDLQAIILMILMFQIAENMYLGDRSQAKLCIVDESWALLSGNTGEFIETGYRRARKAKGSFCSITQSIGDYYKTPAATAALQNSDWIFMLRQKPESIDELRTSKRISMDDGLERLLKSVTTVGGKYSEVMVYGPNIHSVGRLIVDEFSNLLYSTKAEEYQAIRNLQKQGHSIESAIDLLIQERKRRDLAV